MVWFWFLAVAATMFGIGAVFGAPWLPTRKREVQTALELLDLKPGETVIDLGSGSGTFLLAAARQDLRAIGYEINPLLAIWSIVRSWRYRQLISVKFGSYWQQKLPPCDAVYVFLISRYMPKLDAKIKRELTKPIKLASYTFTIPNKQALVEKDGIYLYHYYESKPVIDKT